MGKKLLRTIKKAWNWVWNDDSLLSYIISILLIFLIVKFIIYPGIGLILGTKLPIVAVMSNSMKHSEDFNEWWNNHGDWYEERGINESMFKEFPLRNGFKKGDLIIIKGKKDINIGDVIVFKVNMDYPIIHRVVEIKKINNKTIYETKGDNNEGQIVTPYINELYIDPDQVMGVAWIRIPYLGYPKVLLSKIIS